MRADRRKSKAVSESAMAFTMTAKCGDTAGDPLCFGAVALARWIKNLGKVVIEWRIRRLERKAWKQRRNHQPTPSILRFGPRPVRIEDCLCDVVADLP